MNRLLNRRAATFAATLLFVTTASIASAGWDPAKAARDARDRARRAAQIEGGRAADSVKRATKLNFAVRITNPTGSHLNYSLNGESQLPLDRNSAITWRGSRAGNPTISFGNGHGQTARYTLSRSGNYIFRWVNGTLVLFRQ